jgi:hypothetical protein
MAHYPTQAKHDEQTWPREEQLIVRRRSWQSQEIAALYPRYLAEGPTQLAKELGRTDDSVSSQATRLGLPSLNRRQRQAQTRREQHQLSQHVQPLTDASGLIQ